MRKVQRIHMPVTKRSENVTCLFHMAEKFWASLVQFHFDERKMTGIASCTAISMQPQPAADMKAMAAAEFQRVARSISTLCEERSRACKPEHCKPYYASEMYREHNNLQYPCKAPECCFASLETNCFRD